MATSLVWMSVIGWFVHYIWLGNRFYIPPRIEDMTYNAGERTPFPTNANLHLSIVNQTFREVSASIILDESVISGASIIRDQHFGTSGLSLRVATGKHTVHIVTMGANDLPPYEFTTEEGKQTYIEFVLHRGKSDTNIIYKVRVSNKPGTSM